MDLLSPNTRRFKWGGLEESAKLLIPLSRLAKMASLVFRSLIAGGSSHRFKPLRIESSLPGLHFTHFNFNRLWQFRDRYRLGNRSDPIPTLAPLRHLLQTAIHLINLKPLPGVDKAST